MTGLPPPTERKCFTPCQGDCVLSQWSTFSACSQTCGTSPGIKTRKRHILNPDPNLDMSVQCPHVTERDLIDRQKCGHSACPSFKWDVGFWSSCLIHHHKSREYTYAMSTSFVSSLNLPYGRCGWEGRACSFRVSISFHWTAAQIFLNIFVDVSLCGPLPRYFQPGCHPFLNGIMPNFIAIMASS